MEMETEAIARIAKNALHNQLIFSDGTKMLVHFSTLDKISFQDPDIASKPNFFLFLYLSLTLIQIKKVQDRFVV